MTNYPVPIYLTDTTSTNSYLSALCDNTKPAELTSVYTYYQTAGRGQRGNHWESEAGANLLFSFVMYPHFVEVSQQFLLSQITALSLQEILSSYADDITIKWPNDIYWRNKKLCGTLTEIDLMGAGISRCISGTGINVNQEKFFSDAPNPVSLYQITGCRYSQPKLMHQFMERLSAWYELLKSGDTTTIRTSYFLHLYRREGYHSYRDENGTFQARIVDIEPIGRLMLEDTDHNIRKYMFKEVEYIL